MTEIENVVYVMRLAGIKIQGGFARAFQAWRTDGAGLSPDILASMREALVAASYNIDSLDSVIFAINYLDFEIEQARQLEAQVDA